ncbi:hypothetical protein [Ammoniphilus sp. 3BR4]|uniref:hypothetical protein n=1 Tax=Ammoniphilus sp. 3BR4 TaxID=3158265 RepID=UPI003467C56F
MLVNFIHDVIVDLTDVFGLPLTDKDLHFWLFGLLGFLIYIGVDRLFKWIAKRNISLVSFLYTFTVMAVLALLLEVMQKVTKRGNMEFLDFIYGIWGFIAFWLVFVSASYLWKRVRKKVRRGG